MPKCRFCGSKGGFRNRLETCYICGKTWCHKCAQKQSPMRFLVSYFYSRSSKHPCPKEALTGFASRTDFSVFICSNECAIDLFYRELDDINPILGTHTGKLRADDLLSRYFVASTMGLYPRLSEELYLCIIWGYFNMKGGLSNDLITRVFEKHKDKPLVKGIHEMEMGYKLLDYERIKLGIKLCRSDKYFSLFEQKINEHAYKLIDDLKKFDSHIKGH